MNTPTPVIDAGVDAPAFEPAPEAPLHPTPGKEEDPSLIRAADGTFYLVFYSNRDGGDHLWLTSSRDGKTWTEPRAIVSTSEHDFYPSLSQSSDGTFHLLWWSGSLGDGGKILGVVRYATSKDTSTWSTPIALSNAGSLSWGGSLAELPNNERLVVFSSDEGGADKDLYFRRYTNGSWGAIARRRDALRSDDLPQLLRRADGSLVLVWQRYDPAKTAFEAAFNDLSNDLVYATSADGNVWSDPIAITNDGKPDITPSPFTTSQSTAVAWGSVTEMGAPVIYGASLGSPPQVLSARGGYSPHLLPLGDDLFLMTWVNSLDIYTSIVRFYHVAR